MNYVYLSFLFTIVCSCRVAALRQISDYIKHYEPLSYDTVHLHRSHQRAKRSVNKDVSLQFTALGRDFHLKLQPDASVFTKDFALELSNGALVPHDLSYIYTGRLKDVPDSFVHGSILNGTFDGRIIIPNNTDGIYYVERAYRHFPQVQPFHSIIYSDLHVDIDPPSLRKRRAADQGPTHHLGCGLSDSHVRDWMTQHTYHTVPRKIKEIRERRNIYTPMDRHKRELADDPQRRTCTLFLQSDTMLWERMTNPTNQGGLGLDDMNAKEEITSLFANHVIGLKSIYEDTIFDFPEHDPPLSFKGITFVVRRIKINETIKDCPTDGVADNNFFCRRNIDVSNYLNINSLKNHDDFCLAYAFTYRDFAKGTLGLAWVGSATTASGGICEKYRDYPENARKVSKSLNTGIVTLLNYNQPIATKVSILTFAHEIGHNFGSPHDDGEECTPYTQEPKDQRGNYIMYSSATYGDRPNNNRFSPCSRRNISLVLDAVFHSRLSKDNCFIASESAFCGNNIVESNEQCDCGYADDCKDQCCFGKGNESTQCRLKANTACSPSQGPCCTEQCTMQPDNIGCSMETDCRFESTCSGSNASCPEATAKANGTLCNENTQICSNGECQGSICDNIGWEQCYLFSPKDGPLIDPEDLCELACKRKEMDAPCISTGDKSALDKPVNAPLKQLLADFKNEPIKLPPGAPCENFQGYCDVFRKCRRVDADGPLARLKNLLFNEETFTTIREWIIQHWWAVLLMGIALVIVMGVFIKVCALHTPSSNPKKKPARKLTLPRPTRDYHPQEPPPPYSGPQRVAQPHGKSRSSRNPQSIELRPTV